MCKGPCHKPVDNGQACIPDSPLLCPQGEQDLVINFKELYRATTWSIEEYFAERKKAKSRESTYNDALEAEAVNNMDDLYDEY